MLARLCEVLSVLRGKHFLNLRRVEINRRGRKGFRRGRRVCLVTDYELTQKVPGCTMKAHSPPGPGIVRGDCEIDSAAAASLQESAAQDQNCDTEIDYQSGYVHECSHKRRGRRCRIEAQSPQDERQH